MAKKRVQISRRLGSKQSHLSRLRKIGVFLRHPQLNQVKQNLSLIPVPQCTWLSKKDLNSAELKIVRASRNPTQVSHHGKRRSAVNRGSNCGRQRFGFIRDGTAPGGHVPVLSHGQLCEDHRCSQELTGGRKTTPFTYWNAEQQEQEAK